MYLSSVCLCHHRIFILCVCVKTSLSLGHGSYWVYNPPLSGMTSFHLIKSVKIFSFLHKMAFSDLGWKWILGETTIQSKSWQWTLLSNSVMALTEEWQCPWSLRCRNKLCLRAPCFRLTFFRQALGKDLHRNAVYQLTRSPILFDFYSSTWSPCHSPSPTIPFHIMYSFYFILFAWILVASSLFQFYAHFTFSLKGHLHFFLSEISNFFSQCDLGMNLPSQDN